MNYQNFLNDIVLANKVIASGIPNRFGCRIPVQSCWNLPLFQLLLFGYHDTEILEWLNFGFSISRDLLNEDPIPAQVNHQGAIRFPQAIKNYLNTELKYNAIMGPFLIPPFLHRIGISLLSTRLKQNSQEHRIILDLSFPFGAAVNDGISKNIYCGHYRKLTYPTVDVLAKRVYKMGCSCLLWKRDLKRAFHLLPLCPRDYSLIGVRWAGFLFFDKSVPMGLHSAALCMQRVSSAIVYIHNQMNHWSLNYLDDFGGCDIGQKAWQAVAPSTRMEFLGNLLDSETMTIQITPQRLQELISLLQQWQNKITCTRNQLESLIGKLSFVTNCV